MRCRDCLDQREVDTLVDENGYTIAVPEDSALEIATEFDPSVGGTSPSNWWRIGLVVLAAMILVLLALQMLSGNPGTDVIPGTPVTAPQN